MVIGGPNFCPTFAFTGRSLPDKPSMPQLGRAIIDDDRSENAFGLLMSLNMLIETEGGFDYTAADCMGWMSEAGFTTARAEHLIGPDSMVVAIK